ncbi:MAG: YCF48-related protein, partial [bacterium]
MRKLILLELALLFLATTFQSDNPPGWFQQQLPVSDFINDIFFLDSLNGWSVTNTGYIMKTSNGGSNWNIQIDSAGNLSSIQFLDSLTGYVVGNGNHGIIYTTSNGGTNWTLLHDFNPAARFRRLNFINKDTGWVCSDDIFDGGVFKTTDGGYNWMHQLNYASENPEVVFFTDKDTGWTGNQFRKLYKTTDGGLNWNLQIIFPFVGASIKDILFLNANTGFVSAARIYPAVKSLPIEFCRV